MKLSLIVLTILVYTVVVSGGVTAAIFKSLSVRSAIDGRSNGSRSQYCRASWRCGSQ